MFQFGQEKEKAYWNWLSEAKASVAARPGVAPLYKFDGKSVEAELLNGPFEFVQTETTWNHLFFVER